jgi:peptidoglycan/LPS O-acetylase OafA/YrhL
VIESRTPARIRLLLGGLLAFGALNAFAGGYYGFSGASGVPREWLAGSPFTDYVIPSLILLVVVGGTLALAAVMVCRRHRLARAGAAAAGVVVLLWIIVQVAIIGYVSWMQPATCAAGLLVLLLASLLPSRRTGNAV